MLLEKIKNVSIYMDRHKWLVFIICAIFIMPAIIAMMHMSSVINIMWENRIYSSSDIKHEKGNKYQIILSTNWMNQDEMLISSAEIRENGNPLPYPNSPVDEIEKYGAGRYSVSGGAIHFSSSDNSNPMENGKTYILHWPKPLNKRTTKTIYFIAILSSIVLLSTFRKEVSTLLKNPPFILSAIFFVVPFTISRLWFFVDYPFPAIHPDSLSYYALSESIGNGQWPKFVMRPPLYPIFIKTVYVFSNSLISLIIVQNLLSLISCLIMIYVLHIIRPICSLPAAILLAGWITGYGALEHDTSLLSENLYTTLLVTSFAFLTLALFKKNKVAFALCSLLMALVILTRPAGQYLIIVYLLIMAFMVWNNYDKWCKLFYAAPMPLILILFSLYNYSTTGIFNISAQGEQELAYTTITYWEQDSKYPKHINDGIADAKKVLNLDEKFKYRLLNSRDINELAGLYLKGHSTLAVGQATKRFVEGEENYFQAREWIRKVAFDAIKKNPDVYFRGLMGRLWMYYSSVSYDEDLAVFILLYRARAFYIEKRYSKKTGKPLMIRVGKEYSNPFPVDTVTVVRNSDTDSRIALKPTTLFRAHRALHSIRKEIFASRIWSGIFFICFMISIILLIKRKGRDAASFNMFILGISVIGSSFVASLVEYPQPRYSYTMEWVYFLSPALVILLFNKRDDIQTIPSNSINIR